MSPQILLSTTRRIVSQLRHDRRTLALMLVVPVILLTLLCFMFPGESLPPGVPSRSTGSA
jgi:ABC-2 type transport system permease protein